MIKEIKLNGIKFTAKRSDNDDWVTGHYLVTTAASLGVECDLSIARICRVIIQDGVFYHIDEDTLKMVEALTYIIKEKTNA